MRCLVIGGCGFLGRHLIERLIKQGHSVSAFDLQTTFQDERITFFTGSICNQKDLLPAMVGVDVVFHCATPSPHSNDFNLFYKVNYEGTVNVIEACKQQGVKRLVLTSSASVVFEGRDLCNGNEELPYARTTVDAYTKSKIMQEKLVLAANSDSLFTVAIRPHGIFGPRDQHTLPTAVKMARQGKTKFMIGNGQNVVDFTHVDNVVEGHVLAAEHLGPGSKICGKAYNITNDEPVLFWSFMTELLVGLGYDAPKYRLPYRLIYAIAVLMMLLAAVIRPFLKWNPTLTPLSVTMSGTHHYYSCNRAKLDMGYKPVVRLDRAIAETISSFQMLKNDSRR